MAAALAAQFTLAAWASATILGRRVSAVWAARKWARAAADIAEWDAFVSQLRAPIPEQAGGAAHTARVDWDAFITGVRSALAAERARRAALAGRPADG